MKEALNYFSIEGAYGGNQEWFTNAMMYMGGCGAATACDSAIYFARQFDFEWLYPYDPQDLSKEDYKRFSQIMKPYIRPRVGGVKKLEWYIDGFHRYTKDAASANGVTGEKIRAETFPGSRSYEESVSAIKNQIDAGIPVPYLMLKHKNAERYKDFIWHWFLTVGYEGTEDDLQIAVATYGEKTLLPLRELWDTGYEEKGGIVLYRLL